MRLYSFTNSYLSPIQKGIQTAHIVSEMSSVASNLSDILSDIGMNADAGDYFDWAKEHKTIIVLNGGNSKSLREIKARLIDFNTFIHKFMPEYFVDFFIEDFHEDGDSLDGALTAVGIILPEYLYDESALNSFISSNIAWTWIPSEEERTIRNFFEWMKSFPLAV